MQCLCALEISLFLNKLYIFSLERYVITCHLSIICVEKVMTIFTDTSYLVVSREANGIKH